MREEGLNELSLKDWLDLDLKMEVKESFLGKRKQWVQMHWGERDNGVFEEQQTVHKKTLWRILGYYTAKMNRGHSGWGGCTEKFTIYLEALGSFGGF